MEASFRLSVCIRRSTIPDVRWSWVGNEMSFMLLNSQYIRDLKACAWSHRKLQRMPWKEQ